MAKFLPNLKISEVHGRLQKVVWNGNTQYILPLYHPAAALMSTKVKNAFVSDFGKIQKIITWIDEQNSSKDLSRDIETHLF